MNALHGYDPARPGYHFLPPANWMNDPCGLIQFHGTYHLFYQCNPSSATWGNMTWGHAESQDLIHWTHLPLALYPDQPYDKGGVYTGCALNVDGMPVIFYTGVHPETQCVAFADEALHIFTKYPGNPVIHHPPSGMEVSGFRDPYVWRESDGLRMAVGSGIKGGGGMLLLYRSTDMFSWEYLGPLFSGDGGTGDMWECPNFFPCGGLWVLIVSVLDRAIYFTGEYRENRFYPGVQGEVDLGGSFYAPQIFADEQGRRVMFGWLREWRNGNAMVKAGWAGVQSLPRVIELGADGRLLFTPAEEVKSLREESITFADISLDKAFEIPIPDEWSGLVEIEARLLVAESAGIKFLYGSEEAVLTWNRNTGELLLDTSRGSLPSEGAGGTHGARLPLAGGELLNLRVFLDRSVIEVFANGGTCLTSRVYPSNPAGIKAEIFSCGGGDLKLLTAWKMSPVWQM
jgi:beta-fructofuranosidase